MPRAEALPFCPKSRQAIRPAKRTATCEACWSEALRAVSKIRAGHFTEKSPRAKALRFLCLSRAPNRRFGRLIKKSSSTEYICQGRVTSRGATLFHGSTHALCEIPTYFRQLTYASRRRILGCKFLHAFDCALSGPFDNLHFHPALTIPDSLWAHESPLSPPHRFDFQL